MTRRVRVITITLMLVVVATGAWFVLGGRRAPASERVSAETLKQGGRLYQTNCAACHGERGEGKPNWKSPLADGSYLPPPHDGSGHTWHHADGLLFGIVQKGGAFAAPQGFKSSMPAWSGRLSDAEIVAVLEYIKTFWEPWQREAQAKASVLNPYPVRIEGGN